jgi:hypothetical protein
MSGWQGRTFPNRSTSWLAQRDWYDCGSSGCLFDLIADPTEHVDVAAAHPQVAQAMLERLLELNSTAYDPDRGSDDGAACKAAVARGMVWGPFVGGEGDEGNVANVANTIRTHSSAVRSQLASAPAWMAGRGVEHVVA